MKTTIKIHDSQWFNEHCKLIGKSDLCDDLLPKSDLWDDLLPFETVSWLSGDQNTMSPLEGKILKVDYDIGNEFGEMHKARYRVCSFWIPNWAIEWIKEEQE